MNRRQLLLAGAALGLGAFSFSSFRGGYKLRTLDLDHMPRLEMPPLLDARSSKAPELIAQEGSTVFAGSTRNRTLGFNQSYLGPTLLLENGEFSPVITNRIPTPVSVHWHGLLIAGDHDGGPHVPINQDDVWAPEMSIEQRPATIWYHTHIHQRTAQDVHDGLAGAIHLTDGKDDDRGLPNTYGVDDLTLILQDRRIDESGHVSYELSMPDVMHGFTGDTMVINGQVGTVCVIPKGVVRLRLINGSNARIYTLYFEDGRDFQLIGSDAGYLDKPVSLSKLPLSPGERAELLVDFSDGNAALLKSGGDPNQGPGGIMGRMAGVVDLLVGRDFVILPFVVDERINARITKIPDQIEETDIVTNDGDVIRTRKFSLDMGMMPGAFAINGEPFDMQKINFDVALGSTEKWHITSSMLSHPFHVHGAAFRILSENGQVPQSHNTGVKDTVLVEDEVELLIQFNKPANRQNPFMYHCHILEHEDAGMMGQFTVT